MKYRQTIVLFSAIILLAGCTLWREHEVSSFKDATGGEGLERVQRLADRQALDGGDSRALDLRGPQARTTAPRASLPCTT